MRLRISFLLLLAYAVVTGQESVLQISDSEDRMYALKIIEKNDTLISYNSVNNDIVVGLHDSRGVILSQEVFDSIIPNIIRYEESTDKLWLSGWKKMMDGSSKRAVHKFSGKTKDGTYLLEGEMGGNTVRIMNLAVSPTLTVLAGNNYDNYQSIISIHDEDFNLIVEKHIPQFAYFDHIAIDEYDGIYALGYEYLDAAGLRRDTTTHLIKMDKYANIIYDKVLVQRSDDGQRGLLIDKSLQRIYFLDNKRSRTCHSSSQRIPRIMTIDYDGNILSEMEICNSLPTRLFRSHIGKSGNLYLSRNGGLATPAAESPSNKTNKVMKIHPEEGLVWERQYYYLQENIPTITDHGSSMETFTITEVKDQLFFAGRFHENVITPSNGDQSIFYSVDNTNGNFDDNTGYQQNIGYYHPPDVMVHPRNVVHIYNTDSEESYRYTWHSTYAPDDVGGELLINYNMTGDSGWQRTDRFFDEVYSLDSRFKRVEQSFYNTDVQEWPLFHFTKTYHDYTFTEESTLHLVKATDPILLYDLDVVDIDSISFLDGRLKTRITLECDHTSEAAKDYATQVWIEDLGNPYEYLNTLNACHAPGDEVVTCLYQDGILAWSNPDYNACTTSTTDQATPKKENFLYPNPAQDKVYIKRAVKSYKIVDVRGQLLFTGDETSTADGIDISVLRTGMYYFYGYEEDGSIISSQFVKR